MRAPLNTGSQSGPMRADGGVEAFVGDDEALDRAASDEVLADDLRHVFGFDATVPDSLGVDDNSGAVLALIEASGLVGAHARGEAGSFQGVFEMAVEFTFAVGGTGRAGTAGFANVGANEEMAFEFRQLRLLEWVSNTNFTRVCAWFFNPSLCSDFLGVFSTWRNGVD
jgi:hypothetical protein